MVPLGELAVALGLVKDGTAFVRELFRQIPSGIGFSLVHYPEEASRNHLHIINLLPMTIHGLKIRVQLGPNLQWKPIEYVHRCATDAFGRTVTYKIKVPDTGVYIRPSASFFVPLSSIGANPESSLSIDFEYSDSDGATLKASASHVVTVSARVNEPLHVTLAPSMLPQEIPA